MVKHFVNYAHRGASEYAPENTMMAFHLGIWMGANGIETDVRLTADGVPVLFHDDTLLRMTGQAGTVSDYDLEQLQQFRVEKAGRYDYIPTLEEFLQQFSRRDITFAIELKQENTAQPVASLLDQYAMAEKTVVTSFDYEELCRFRKCAPNYKTGYLTFMVTDALLADMQKQGITQLCPKADLLHPKKVDQWHRMGFSVRAWGVTNEALMRHAYDCGVDGMTVNFPDKLVGYMEKCYE